MRSILKIHTKLTILTNQLYHFYWHNLSRSGCSNKCTDKSL